jgi:signal transduction histidine kinase
MLFSGIAIYFILSLVINQQMDEQLAGNVQSIQNQLAEYPQTDFFDPLAEIEKIGNNTETTFLSDTLIFNEKENELEEYRQIISIKKIGETYYKITVRKSKIESEDLLATLVLVTVLAMLILTFTLILVNRKVAQSVWLPFYTNLKIVGQFSINQKEPVNLEPSGITEFDQLNTVLTKLTKQIISDFQNQKQFSEDVSHELQTPLAIINSQLETFLNEPDLTQQHAEAVGKIYDSVRRLSKLNKELVLLMKIENKQFPVSGTVNLSHVFDNKIAEFAELIELKNLSIETNFANNFEVEMPGLLAEILANNLLMNSINHNLKDGKIIIETDDSFLKISNSGNAAIARPEMLFNRFYKENVSSNSVGLGLAIVKKICDNYSLSIDYSFSENAHTFTLTNSL